MASAEGELGGRESRYFDVLADLTATHQCAKGDALPRYIRANTLKVQPSKAHESLEAFFSQKLGSNGDQPHVSADPHIPALFACPHGVEMHANPAVEAGEWILQDKVFDTDFRVPTVDQFCVFRPPASALKLWWVRVQLSVEET